MHTTTIIRPKAAGNDTFGQLVHVDADPARQQLNRAVAGFLAGYSGQTLTAYRIDLTKFIDWLDNKSVAAFDAERAHIELYARWSETQGLAPATIGRRLSTICGFYTYCTEERLLERNPAAHVRRPKQNYESSTLGLDRNELGGFLVQAGLCGGRDRALACLLALNGLRISEALGADIDDLDHNRGHRTLFIHRKGGKTATIPLAPRTTRALDLYIDQRVDGPIFMNHDMTRRLDRHAASRIVKRLAKAAGIETPSITWPEAVDEALCYGWIDSKIQSIDNDRYEQYFCPRKPTSPWSKVNKTKIESLQLAKRIQPAGAAAIETAKENGSWSILDDAENHIVPDDLAAALADRDARKNFDRLSPSRRRNILQWIVLAKRADTRQRRLQQTADAARHGKAPNGF